MRSLLFVPADDSRKIAKATSTKADALILDLEDAVAEESKERARVQCEEALTGLRDSGKKLFVRINALDTVHALHDLAAVVKARPYGIVLPKCRHGDDVRLVANYLSSLEARDGLPIGQTQILPIATEVGAAMFTMGSYASPLIPRLTAMMWGGEDLAADIGATANRRRDGGYAVPYRLAQTLCLLAATSSASIAVDAVFTDFRDSAGLEAEAMEAATAGFTAKAAIHPDQIEVINRVFSPTDAEIEWAKKIVNAFRATRGAGTTSIDGKMLDRPHLRNAERVLARSRA